MVTCGDTTDSNQEKTILFTRNTTPKSEDNLQLVVRKRLLEGTDRIQRENLQGSVVESDRNLMTSGNLNVDLSTVQCFVKPQEKEALGHKKAESGKSGRPGIPDQTGNRKKVDSGTVPQEKVRTFLNTNKIHQQKSASKLPKCSKVERDGMAVGGLARKAVRIDNILTGNEEGNLQRLLRKTVLC